MDEIYPIALAVALLLLAVTAVVAYRLGSARRDDWIAPLAWERRASLARAWVNSGTAVRCFAGDSGKTVAVGRVVGVHDHPTIRVWSPSGRTRTWAAHLAEAIEDDDLPGDRELERAHTVWRELERELERLFQEGRSKGVPVTVSLSAGDETYEHTYFLKAG